MEKEESVYKVVTFKPGRFAIAHESGEIVDDAQGYGYKDRQKAQKAIWYKFKGGKKSIDIQQQQFNSWLKIDDNKKIYNRINDLIEINFKEIHTGETTIKKLINIAEEEFLVELPHFVKKYL
jgi:hypothetical protein